MGGGFRSSTDIDPTSRDILFCTLILTSACCFMVGNLLLLNPETLRISIYIMPSILAWFAIFYAATIGLGGAAQGFLVSAAIAIAAVWLRHPWMIYGFYILGVLGAVFCIRRVRLKSASLLWIALMAVIGAAVSFSCFPVLTDFDNLNLMRRATAHQDLLYHTAIAAMVKNYGVVSTGLHGLVETPYYVFVHTMAALFSKASLQGVFEVWGMLLFVFCMPMLLFSVCYLSVFLGMGRTNIFMSWVFICLSMVLPQKIFGAWLPNDWMLISESQVLGLSILALSLPLLLKEPLDAGDILFSALTGCLLAFTKSPTAIIYAGLWGSRWLILKRGCDWRALFVSLAGILAAIGFAMPVARSADRETAVQFGTEVFKMIQMSASGAPVKRAMDLLTSGQSLGLHAGIVALVALGAFFTFHFIASWVVLGHAVYLEGRKVLWNNPYLVYVWASVAGGCVFIVFMAATQPVDIFWFSNPSFIIALSGIAAGVGSLDFFEKRANSLMMYFVLLCIIVLTSVRSYYRHSYLAPFRNKSPRGAFVDAMLSIRHGTSVSTCMLASEDAWALQPVLYRNRPAIMSAPLAFPAISERAWINVIRPNVSKGGYDVGYGYPMYEIDSESNRVQCAPVLPPNVQILKWRIPKEVLADQDEY